MTSEGDITSVLAASGLVPGSDGYDLAEVMATVERRGWACWVEPLAAGADDRERWRAVVFEPGTGSPAGRTRGYRGRGPTQAAALALALGRMLARRGA